MDTPQVDLLPRAAGALPHVFGVRHLSPGASFHLLALLDAIKPEAVLVEGPSDATSWIPHLVSTRAKPPVALLAYTEEAPVRSFLLPFAAYSPEYQALRWALNNKAKAEFIDLPSSVFLALQVAEEERRTSAAEAMPRSDAVDTAEATAPLSFATATESLYVRWAKAAGVDDYESYWESAFEHNLQPGAYHEAAFAFGAGLRALDESSPDRAETLVREAFMRRAINRVIDSGIAPEKIVVVTGAFHAPVLVRERTANGLTSPDPLWGHVLTDEEEASLPRLTCSLTLMPYSDLRLSSRAGYGAGNDSPKYFQMLWEAMQARDLAALPARFFTDMARFMREKGTFRSPAELIEAVTLAKGLALLREESHPTLETLRQAAMTCLGQGELSFIAEALAFLEIGTGIGELPEGVSRTAIQDDFYRELKSLKLEPYKSTVAKDLVLDLRENRAARQETSRWLDLRRSRFLHQLTVLGVRFAAREHAYQETATWKENWVLRWTPEAEIELVESALKGETVAMAASHALGDVLARAKDVAVIAGVIEQAALCGLEAVLELARKTLQSFAVESEAIGELATGAHSLAATVHYGDLRQVPTEPLLPLLAQLFFRSVLILVDSCRCNNDAARQMFEHLHSLNSIGKEQYEHVDDPAFIRALQELAGRDNLNPGLSGYAASLLLERGLIPEHELEIHMLRRLSPGIEADIGAGWFEGLAKRNHYGLLSRRVIWELLDTYLATLDEAAFMRALVFLRRAFADFSPTEKRAVCDILGDLWNISGELVEDALSKEYTEEETTALNALNDFDFSDL